MSDKQAFVITTASCRKFLTRNYTMRTNEQGALELAGDFVYFDNEFKTTGGWAKTLPADNGFHTWPATDDEIALLISAEDKARVENLAAHLIGLTENLIDKHLPQEFKTILLRTPEVIGTLTGLMHDGIRNALDNLGKGK